MDEVRLARRARCGGCSILVAVGIVVAMGAGPSQAGRAAVRFEPWAGSMFSLYQDNRQKGIGNHITVDFVLSSYSLFVGDLLTDAEETLLVPGLADLDGRLLEAVGKQPSSPGRDLALAYLGVIARLLDPAAAVPAEVESKVAAEITLVADARTSLSAVTGAVEDFTQYRVRGKYERSEVLRRYFKAAMYAGRIGFHLLPSKATGVSRDMAEQQTAAALLLARAVAADQGLRSLVRRLDDILSLFVGPSDDLTLEEYACVAGADDLDITAFGARVLAAAKAAGRLPRITSEIVNEPAAEDGRTMAEVTAGMRLLGQRHTPESEAFQRLTRDDLAFTGSGEPLTMADNRRALPSILDLGASLGSGLALQVLEARGDAAYTGFGAALDDASTILRARASQPLSLGDTVLQLVQRLGDTNLNAALGLWIRTRREFILYTKQAYSGPKGVTLDLGARRDRRWASIDEELSIYEPLIGVCERAIRAVGPGALADRAETLRQILVRLRTIAGRQRTGKPLMKEDVAYLNEVDSRFRSLSHDVDEPVIADLYTYTNAALVLEVGVGFPTAETRTWPKRKSRGARFTCYQFPQPMPDRLTDDAWQMRLIHDKTLSPLDFGMSD